MNKHYAQIDGQTFTRNSQKRVYTHVVVCKDSKDDPTCWGQYGWAGRLDLAEKNAAKWRKLSRITEVRIIEAHQGTPPADKPKAKKPAAKKVKAAPKLKASKLTREEWLNAFTDASRPFFKEHGSPLPKKVRCSVGFPSKGQRSNTIGECWQTSVSEDKVSEIFLRPSLQSDSRRIAGVLVHELVHAAGHWDHGAGFRKVATALGLGGKMTATIETDAFYEWADPILKKLGAFPGASLKDSKVKGGKKKQTTRMVKCECRECGFIFRTTRSWIEKSGNVQCPDGDCIGDVEVG